MNTNAEVKNAVNLCMKRENYTVKTTESGQNALKRVAGSVASAMEINKAIKILDNALKKIPYKNIDLKMTINNKEITYYEEKNSGYGFRRNNEKVE